MATYYLKIEDVYGLTWERLEVSYETARSIKRLATCVRGRTVKLYLVMSDKLKEVDGDDTCEIPEEVECV